MKFAESRNAYMPRHVPRGEARDLKRIAVLLPFSSTDPEVRTADQRAVQRCPDGDVRGRRPRCRADSARLRPIDGRAGHRGRHARRGRRRDRAAFRPAFPAVRPGGRVGAPVLAFSTDVSANGQGAYPISLTPKTEVQRIVDWAATQGITRFAMFGPDTKYGHTVEKALRQDAAERGVW